MVERPDAAQPAEPQDKASLLRRIDETRARYEGALTAIARLEEPLRDDGWTARDIAAHVAIWERRLARDIATSLRGEEPARPEPGYTWEQMDALNISDNEAARLLTPEQAWAEIHAAYQETRSLVASLSEETLFTPGRFGWLEGERLALWVRYDMWEHYEEHTLDLEPHD